MRTLALKCLWRVAACIAILVPTSLSAADTAAYARVLDRFVSPTGLVDYAGLLGERADLDLYVGELSRQDPTEYQTRTAATKIAFWINAYNALTLQTIIDNYPIEASGLPRLRYPASSIRQISGAWTAADHVVMGERVSLDQIEHEILRRDFAEPRVHMALVCAALGCPPLRREPYVGDRLDEQLDDQARRYLASPAGSKVESERRVAVSEIFRWFGGDFSGYAGSAAELSGVEGFIARYAPAPTARLVRAGARLRWIDYDWTLNDQNAR